MAEANDDEHTLIEKQIYKAGLKGGLTSVAEGAIVSYPTVFNINRGFNIKAGKIIQYHPNPRTVQAIADFFGCTPEEVWEDRFEKVSKQQGNASAPEKVITKTFKVS